jgi:hypothetical protein
VSEEELDLSLFECEECGDNLEDCECDADFDEDDEADWEEQ